MRGVGFIRRSRAGLSPLSQLAERLGRTRGGPKLAGVKVSGPDDVLSWKLARRIANGEYDFPGLRPEPGSIVIDVGANIGIYALWAARRGATLTAYEPNPETFQHLQANVRGRSVKAVQAAVVGARTPSTVSLYLHENRRTRDTVIGRDIAGGGDLTRRVEVPAVGISEVLSSECDVVKLDCEGSEFAILDAASDETLRRAGAFVLEFHRIAGDPADLLRRLEAAGFGARILSGAEADQPFGLIGAVRR